MSIVDLGLVWIRRDFRLFDHHALTMAAKTSKKIIACFIFDPTILNGLSKNDPRISFIMDCLKEIDAEIRTYGSKLIIRYGQPIVQLQEIITEYHVNALFYNRDYEPYAQQRDQMIDRRLTIPVHSFKDAVIFEKDEIKSKAGGYYTVFTPYKNAWLSAFRSPQKFTVSVFNFAVVNEESGIHQNQWFDRLGFNSVNCRMKGGRIPALAALHQFKKNILNYNVNRDYPSRNATSQLSPYLRFGCISIRELVQFSCEFSGDGPMVWLSELIWRDFYQMICHTHPNCHNVSIKPEYDNIQWRGTSAHFEAWSKGQTGVPIIDAAMRELNTTGLMHNRCRMIVASFLCKTLLVNWRLGEAYFAKKLLDFDFASNNGGWAWASSSGCDAQPYFRIFNPYLQSKKFDPAGDYIRKYCPELAHLNVSQIHDPPFVKGYPLPIVNYSDNRKKALEMYAVVKR
jgi:deoxyribodipyrimidine photo-lyase